MSSSESFAETMMYMQNEKDFEPVRLLRTMFHHNGKYYQLQIVTSMVEEDDLIAELFYAMLWLYIGLVASILILNNFLLKRIWKPFYQLLKQLKKFKLESPSNMTFKKTSIDEFNLLLSPVLSKIYSEGMHVRIGIRNIKRVKLCNGFYNSKTDPG